MSSWISLEIKPAFKLPLRLPYTYVLRCSDGSFTWVQRLILSAVSKNRSGLVPATSYRLPAKLVYYEACQSQVEAFKRELQLKTGFGRRYLKGRLGM